MLAAWYKKNNVRRRAGLLLCVTSGYLALRLYIGYHFVL